MGNIWEGTSWFGASSGIWERVWLTVDRGRRFGSSSEWVDEGSAGRTSPGL